MSQIYKNISAGSLPPSVPTSFTADTGSAVPSGNILIVHGYDSSENNDNGITTKGGVAAGNPPGSGLTNELDVYLTNRQTATVTTADATPTTILTFSLSATPGVYYISGDIVAFDTTDTAGAAYGFVSGMRSDGIAATEIATELKDLFEETALATSDFNVLASGNNVIVQVTGIAGKNIDWSCMITYRFVS